MTNKLMTYLCMGSLAMSGAFAWDGLDDLGVDLGLTDAQKVGIVKHRNSGPDLKKAYMLSNTDEMQKVLIHKKNARSPAKAVILRESDLGPGIDLGLTDAQKLGIVKRRNSGPDFKKAYMLSNTDAMQKVLIHKRNARSPAKAVILRASDLGPNIDLGLSVDHGAAIVHRENMGIRDINDRRGKIKKAYVVSNVDLD